MLFPDIKVYLIEIETEIPHSEAYVLELEQCKSLEQMLNVVMDYKGLNDEMEASSYILSKICE